MKLSAPRDAILKPLQSVIGVVERRQTMPILANVLLTTQDSRLQVAATDLEVELVAETEVEVETPRRNHRTWAQAARHLQGSARGSQCRIECLG